MEDRVGQQFGNYRLTQLIGHGGFAEVYLGEHVRLNTQAAIKVLHTQLADQEVNDFQREAQTIARLDHPNIVRVLDFDVVNGVPFLVMSYAPNGTLRQRHPKGTRLPLPIIVSYVKQVASALQYAHEDRLVHRDVKTENMLVGRRNEVLLSDFGIALVAQSSRYQNTQDVTGTVAYMSPEQIQGKPRPASDQYSLGIVVYEWLTGDRPFHGSFTELCTQHMFATLPSMREKAPTISPSVEQVVSIALAKDYKQRFQSVQAFANAFEQASMAEVPNQPEPSKILTLQASDQMVVTPPSVQAVEVPPLAPTQLAVPHSLPPIELAPISSSSEPASLSSGNSTTTGEKLIPEPAKREEQKVQIWTIGRRQIVAMVVGAILYGLLIQGSIALPVSTFTILFPALIISLFFGAVFGPWVGLFIGLVGYFINQFLPFGNHSYAFTTNLGHALAGFIAGIALVVTRGQYSSARNSFIAGVFAVLALALGFGFALSTLGLSPSEAWSVFISLFLTNGIYSLIALPILLLIYNAIIKGMSKQKKA